MKRHDVLLPFQDHGGTFTIQVQRRNPIIQNSIAEISGAHKFLRDP